MRKEIKPNRLHFVNGEVRFPTPDLEPVYFKGMKI